MFGLGAWNQYKARLATVKRELEEINEDMMTVPVKGGAQPVALAVSKVCKILVRVIDSLPG